MTNIANIFGLQSRQIIEPQLLDVKFFHDQTYLWRARVRLHLHEVRRSRVKLAESRILAERHLLNMELAGLCSNFCNLWEIYRTVTREAWRLDEDYRAGLEQRMRRLRGNASA